MKVSRRNSSNGFSANGRAASRVRLPRLLDAGIGSGVRLGELGRAEGVVQSPRPGGGKIDSVALRWTGEEEEKAEKVHKVVRRLQS